MTTKHEVLLVGSYPPPYGGCSVHIQRLQKCLVDVFDINVLDMYSDTTAQDGANHVYRCGRKRPYNLLKAVFALARSNARLVHFHVAAMGNFLFAGFFLLFSLRNGVRKVITIHSGSFVKNFANINHFKKSLLVNLLRKFDHIVTVNAEQKEMIGNLGIAESRISVAPAFLPPIAKASGNIMRTIDELRTKGKTIIVSSGYALPYYGFHIILDALDCNPEFKNQVSVIFCFYNTYDPKYVADIESRLEDTSHIIFNDLEPDEFSYVLSCSDIYIRATDRDGDAVAIREAAFYGKKIIASDCVERPAGSILFNVDHVSTLSQAMTKAMHEDNVGIVTFDYSANLRKIKDVYREVLNMGVDNETNITKS